MIISLALLAPIVAVLYWIYARTGSQPLTIADWVILSLVAVVVLIGTVLTHLLVGEKYGALWVYVLAPMVGYGLLLIGTGLLFWWRSRRGNK